ncbi:MAG: hypothetical protein LBB45_05020 [Methanobrevibacter sp.]|jgi:hypothetical protein|nr:hypothetical protein [Candidatus Methanovirga basalitermitum]
MCEKSKKDYTSKYSIFRLTPLGLICISCNSSWSLLRKHSLYISIPANPTSERNIIIHLNSKLHRLGLALYHKKIMKEGALVKEMKAKDIKIKDNINPLEKNHSVSNQSVSLLWLIKNFFFYI